MVDSCFCPHTVIRNRQAFADVEMGVGNTIEAKFMARRERPRSSDFGCQARQTPTRRVDSASLAQMKNRAICL